MAKSLRAFRQVTSASAEELAPFRSVRSIFPKRQIRPLAQFQATIVAEHESRFQTDQLFRPLEEVFYPLPETGKELLTLDVMGAEYFMAGKGMGDRALALLLDDPSGILAAERAEFFERMRKPLPKRIPKAHVSLFIVAAENAEERIRKWAESTMPTRIELLPIHTPSEAHTPQTQPGELVPAIEHPPLPMIRTLSQQAIPLEIYNRIRGIK